MGRTTVAVIVGYLVMFAVVFVLFTVAYLVMGANRAFEAGSFDVSSAWVLTSLVVGIVAAIAGGYVCAAVARSPKAPVFLAVLVVVLGVLLALPALMSPNEGEIGPRTGDVDNFEAMSKAKQPTWITLVNPIIGAVGVLLGGSMRKKPRAA